MVHILYNPKSNQNRGRIAADRIAEQYENPDFTDITTISDFAAFFSRYDAGDTFVICGGDGTLNHFVNDTARLELPEKLFFSGAGTGNDFLRDLGTADIPVPIGDYITRLPTVTVKGKRYKFINGVGFGIDGYCCEVGDRLRETTDEPINYAGIAVKGLLFHFKPVRAAVTVDGKTKEYHIVWLAPTMKGRYYGGGMMAAPAQDRRKPGKVSVLVMYGSGKLKTLTVFPSIFKGEHIHHTEMVEVREGHDISVRFDRPCALQIDGETILDVTEYEVTAE
ncbi:MAG: diacylglycerol kinase family protein [Clostridia bacterium]|nr:diacylglycerol kinase family protein [Clostridia bacterium]